MMKERAKERRRNRTDAENRMWYYLSNRRLSGYKFVREQVIGNYIADFVCRARSYCSFARPTPQPLSF